MAKRVFVVDDERGISDSLSMILRQSGFEASAFYDAESALAACGIAPPEFIVSDVLMPGMSGVEMAIVIKERHPACDILLFSGQAATTDILEQARQKGYNFELLLKPVNPKDLVARLTGSEPHPETTFDRKVRASKTA